LIAGVAVLVVAAIGGAAWLLLRHPADVPKPSPSPATRRVAPPPATPTPAAVPGATTGTVHVDANVAGAEVSVDGRPLGPAPQVAELGPGSHRLRVVRDGFEPYEREVHVVPGRTARLTARLDAEAARLRVDADVPGASVFLDRRFLGTTPVETRDFAPGTHRLNVSAEGYEMYAETIEIGAGRREITVRFKEVRLDESLPVVHRHGMGSCRGTLSATTAGLRYDTPDAADGFSAPFSAVEPLQVDYLKKNLKVKLKSGKTYNFGADTADALLSFQKTVEAARKRL
jgi:PEGA domain